MGTDAELCVRLMLEFRTDYRSIASRDVSDETRFLSIATANDLHGCFARSDMLCGVVFNRQLFRAHPLHL